MSDAKRCTAARDLVARLPERRVPAPAHTLGEVHGVLTGKTGPTATDTKTAILSWADTYDVTDSTVGAMRATRLGNRTSAHPVAVTSPR